MEDSEIINLYFNRNEDAIVETNKKYGKRLCKIAFNILGNMEDAEECVNTAYLKIWDSIPPNNPLYFSAYVGKIVRNLALHTLEKSNAKKRGLGQSLIALEELEESIVSSTVVNDYDESEFMVVLNEFLDKLPKEKRQIFVSRYWAMMSVKDIADKYHISEGKVKTVLFRLRNKFKHELDKRGFKL